MPRHPESLAERRVGGPLRFGCIIILGLLASIKIKYLDLIAPVPQPERTQYVALDDPYGGEIPEHDADIETILQCNHENLHHIFQKYGNVPATGFIRFFPTYRNNPAILQENSWEGPCNQFVECFGEAMARRGHSVYIVNLWPKEVRLRLTTNWHQIGVVCIEPHAEYLIVDNNKITRHRGTLEEYVETEWNSHCIPEICSIRRWYRTQDNFFARTFIQMGPNEEMELTPVPIPKSPPLLIASEH